MARAVWRGFRGRCPACGQGRILRAYLAPEPACGHCGEDLTPYRTADFAPYLVTFAIGPVFIPLALLLALRPGAGSWALWVLVPAALALAAILLPRAKGAAVGLLWALDVRS